VSQTFGNEIERRYKGDLLRLFPVPEDIELKTSKGTP
jgi:hypothetical protein